MLIQDKSRFHYMRYMLAWKAKGYLSAMFPSKEHILKEYPFVKNKPWLLTVAWLHRLIIRGTMALINDRTANQIRTENTEVTTEVKERVDLFQILDMI